MIRVAETAWLGRSSRTASSARCLAAPSSSARPLAVTRAAHEFAARHPEVSRFVPCYCGCEADGHRDNAMCFVGRRDAAGNVVEWDTHGFGCATCVDVARESMQLYNSGADVASIRAAIERKWTPQHHTKTPTPPVPPKKR